jgi:hypothetical protein
VLLIGPSRSGAGAPGFPSASGVAVSALLACAIGFVPAADASWSPRPDTIRFAIDGGVGT